MPIVLVCNADLDIVWVDASFCDVVDCERHPALGRSLPEFFAVPSGESLRKRLAEVAEGRGRAKNEVRLPGVDGRPLQIEFSIEPTPAFDGLDGPGFIAVGVLADDAKVGGRPPEATAPASLRTADPLRRTYRYSNLRLEDGAALFARLEQLVEAEESFRTQTFTLERAAERLGTNALYVSQAINFFSGVSFPNYLNGKRLIALEAAMRDRPNASFEDLWRQAGFGSYSSLNRYLKAAREISPSEFVKRQRGEE